MCCVTVPLGNTLVVLSRDAWEPPRLFALGICSLGRLRVFPTLLRPLSPSGVTVPPQGPAWPARRWALAGGTSAHSQQLQSGWCFLKTKSANWGIIGRLVSLLIQIPSWQGSMSAFSLCLWSSQGDGPSEASRGGP